LAEFLQIPAAKTAKAVFLMASIPDGQEVREQFVFAVVRGDMDVNETKLANAIGAQDLRPATEEEIRAVGAVPGYASPIGLKNVLVVVDDLVPQSPNLVAGANDEGYHLLHTNYGRDYTATIVTDLSAARDGDGCPLCGRPMRATRGVEVGNIFKLGTRYTDALGCTFLDENGASKPVVMGSYGIGVGRLLACAAEEHHDEKGLTLPISIAPYAVHLVRLASKSGAAETAAEEIYTELQAAGIEVLYDDRIESAGVKFNDADLIGLPLRLTVGERALAQGGVESRRRATGESRLLPREGLVEAVRAELDALWDEVSGG
ncbi:MAG: YbaK/EbsC family protein, partial [Anaerolineaceae bacterium]